MKVCQPHWTELKEAIAARGLDQFVARDGAEVARRMAADGAAAEAAKASFEPLMGAHNAILSNALRIVGTDVFLLNEDGSDRCPLCYLGKVEVELVAEHGRESVGLRTETWIGRAADDMLAHAKALGLIGEG